MSIEALSATLTNHGVKHVVVVAKSAKKFDSIESFAKSISDSAVRKYAEAYYKWVSEGRKGGKNAAPKADSDNYQQLKYVRIVVSQLV